MVGSHTVRDHPATSDRPSLEGLDSADRGFLTLVAAFASIDLRELWDRIGVEVVGGHLVALDLSPVARPLLEGRPPHLALPLAGLDHLERLDVTGLGLATLDVRALSRLRSLRCGLNRLHELDLSDNGALESLDCSGNRLIVLDLRANPALVEVRCPGNRLGGLVLPRPGRLEVLEAQRNGLISLELGAQPALRSVRVFRNALMRLELTEASQLANLDLSRNELAELALPELPALQRLAVAFNRLRELPLGLEEQGHPELRHVDASRNHLSSLALGPCPSLVELDVSGNQLYRLELGRAPALEVVRAARNHLAQLALSGQSNLSVLDCSYNELAALDPSACPGLVELDCVGNPLTRLDVRENRQLWRLSAPDAPKDGLLTHDWQRKRLSVWWEAEAGAAAHRELGPLGPFELHAVALALRRSPDDQRLLELVQHPRCDLGTALLIYWTRSPHYYLQYTEREQLPEYERPGWDVLRAIEERVQAAGYPPPQIPFDPRHDTLTRPRGVDWTVRPMPSGARREIPAVMREAVTPRTSPPAT